MTDHAPHHEDEKNVEFALASNGFIGFESALPLINAFFIQTGLMSLERMVELTSVNPSRLLNIGGGTLAPGAPADVLIADLGEKWIFDRFKTASKSSNSPFHGFAMQGRAKWTIVDGEVAYEELR